MLEATAFLHELTLIHTDLKPENILLTSSDYNRTPPTYGSRCPQALLTLVVRPSTCCTCVSGHELGQTRHPGAARHHAPPAQPAWL